MEHQTVVTSELGKLNLRDLAQGAIMAGLGAVSGIIYPLLESGNLEFDWLRMAKMAAGFAIAHVLRKLLSPPVIVMTNPTQKAVELVKAKEATVTIETTTTGNPIMEINQSKQNPSI